MAHAKKSTLTILLADDMAHFLNLEVSFLRRADCRVITAADGAQALVLAKKERPDLLLLDVEMPRMTGIEVCRLLRQDPGFADVPIIMVTSTDRKQEARQAGATAFWKKPIREDDFMAGVMKFLPIKVRDEERVSIGLPAEVSLGDRVVVSGMTRDLSATGTFILCDARAEPDAPVAIELHLGFEAKAPAVSLKGRVARVTTGQDGGIGVEFTGPATALKRLRDYVIKL